MALWICPWKAALMAVISALSYSVFLLPHILISCATAALFGTGQGIDPTENENFKKKYFINIFNVDKYLGLVPCQHPKPPILCIQQYKEWVVQG